ncbi:hypothetical protein AZE42_08934 [Rhizopogon vesiculosus]|uniref:Uncharacterized protein n=1 Tax=Rhizopogon vesiculosus TaxID=180088 RepID=A0A1J8Q2H0_9AGAM|nr:hypothetical protein AZE42_08934 [Rhizopogon vesiculosus]
MADLPDEQDYYTFTSESYGTKQPIGMTFDEGEGILRAMPGKKTAWTVQYIDRERGIYKAIHPKSGLHQKIRTDSPVTLRNRSTGDSRRLTTASVSVGNSMARRCMHTPTAKAGLPKEQVEGDPKLGTPAGKRGVGIEIQIYSPVASVSLIW